MGGDIITVWALRPAVVPVEEPPVMFGGKEADGDGVENIVGGGFVVFGCAVRGCAPGTKGGIGLGGGDTVGNCVSSSISTGACRGCTVG